MNVRLTAVALALALSVAPAFAASSAASSASDSASDSVGSLSKSIGQSSDSSSGDKKVAAGDYKVIEMAAAPGQAGMLTVKLQALAEGAPGFTLTLPVKAAENGHLVAGAVITAQDRPYGLELLAAAQGEDRKAFFLLVDDEWHQELKTRAVVL